jgi:hypothetical protein
MIAIYSKPDTFLNLSGFFLLVIKLLKTTTTSNLAPIELISFYGGVRHKRYKG